MFISFILNNFVHGVHTLRPNLDVVTGLCDLPIAFGAAIGKKKKLK